MEKCTHGGVSRFRLSAVEKKGNTSERGYCNIMLEVKWKSGICDFTPTPRFCEGRL